MIFFSNQLTYCDNYWQRFWQLQQSKGVKGILTTAWSYFWLRFAGLGYGGRIATWLATWFAPPYKMRRSLARYYKSGYVSPSATIEHDHLQLGANIYIGDRVKIIADPNTGFVELANLVHLHNDICIQTGDGGSLQIGEDTHIQPRCQFSAYQGLIQIGSGVQIASSCVFCLGDDQEGRRQEAGGRRQKLEVGANGRMPLQKDRMPLQKLEVRSKEIIVEDDAWIGHGAMILDGVRIGKGAVIGSGAVVSQDIPDGAIAVGIPARVVGNRK
jgi:acetyltransferase-like isoleucine patch superfamily enzyme